MRSLFLTILSVLLYVGSLNAQKLQVAELSALPSNLYARENPRTDANGKYCAMLIVDVAGVNDLVFSGTIIGETVHNPGGYYVYVSTDTESINFIHPTYGEGGIDFARAGIDLEEKTVYKVVLQKAKMRKSILQVSPSKASVNIDDKVYSPNASGEVETDLEVGMHNVKIEYENYEPLNTNIEVVEAESPYVQNFRLQGKLVKKIVKCNAPDPSLFVDDEEYDIEGKFANVPIGNHSVRMTANGYAEKSSVFFIQDDKEKLSLRLDRLPKQQKGLCNRFVPLTYLSIGFGTYLSTDNFETPDIDEIKANLGSYSQATLGIHQNLYFNFISGFHWGFETNVLLGEDLEEDFEAKFAVPALLFFDLPVGAYHNYRIHFGAGPIGGIHLLFNSESDDFRLENTYLFYGARAESTFMFNKFLLGASVDAVNESESWYFVPSIKIGFKL